MGWGGTAKVKQRFRLLFATSDDSALGDISQELAPTFFISIAATPSDLLSSIKQTNPEIIVLYETVIPSGEDLFFHISNIRSVAPEALVIAISRRPLRKARQRTLEAGGDEFLLAPSISTSYASTFWRRQRIASPVRGPSAARRDSEQEFLLRSDRQQRRNAAASTRPFAAWPPGTTTMMLRGESGTGKRLGLAPSFRLDLVGMQHSSA